MAAPGADTKARLRERGWTMWRYREWLPLTDGEAPVSLGEGGTPLVALHRLGAKYGLPELALKEEGTNPTGSFKARGLAAAVTRAVRSGAKRFVVPTAGNAGIALAAYAARAGASARVYAPTSTPRRSSLRSAPSAPSSCSWTVTSVTAVRRRAPTRPRRAPWTCRPCASPTASRARRPSVSSWRSKAVGRSPPRWSIRRGVGRG